MGDKSAIEWTDATWNPVTGCSKVSQGCKNCYAERLAPKVFAGQMMVDHYVELTAPLPPRPRRFTDVLCHPERLDQPLHWKKPRRIFVNSMSDLFHEDVPDDFLAKVFCTMSEAHQHQFQVLTKRPERMRETVTVWDRVNSQDFPLPNVWFGVSVEDQETADYRIPLLLQTPAAVRFVSYEPALGPVDFTQYLLHTESGDVVYCADPSIQKLHWVIAGGESGPGARPPNPNWFRSVRDQCAAAGIAFFFKQWGQWAPPIPEGDVPPGALEGRMYRVGKKAAGCHLDGRTHNEYPA